MRPSRIFLIAVLFLSFMGPDAPAQVTRKKVQESNDTIPFKDRLSFGTNAINWALLQANASVEFDLVGRDYNRWSVVLSVKGKWEPHNSRKTYNVYNLAEYRLEGRHYYRTAYKAAEDTTYTLGQRLFSRYRRKPRTYRAYYLGGYASYGSYALKFSHTGKEGQFASVGASFGWSVPLYSYKKWYVDLELGASLGVVMTRYDVFRFDDESNCYPHLKDQDKGWHLVPFPLPTDVHCSFILRTNSVKNKFKEINYARRDKLAAKRKIKLEKEAADEASGKAKGVKGLFGKINPFKKKKSVAASDSLPKDSLSLSKDKESKKLKKEKKEKKEKVVKEKKSKKKDKDKSKDSTPEATPENAVPVAETPTETENQN